MTVDEMREILGSKSREWPSFACQAYKPHPRSDISAMITLDRLSPGSGRIVSAAEHDEIWFDAEIESVAANATPADIKLLAACRVRLDGDSFAMYV